MLWWWWLTSKFSFIFLTFVTTLRWCEFEVDDTVDGKENWEEKSMRVSLQEKYSSMRAGMWSAVLILGTFKCLWQHQGSWHHQGGEVGEGRQQGGDVDQRFLKNPDGDILANIFLILFILAQWYKLGPKTNHKNISSKLFLEIHLSINRCTISALKWYILMSTTSMVSSSLMSLPSTGLSTSNSYDLNVVTNIQILKETLMSTTITTAYHTLV